MKKKRIILSYAGVIIIILCLLQTVSPFIQNNHQQIKMNTTLSYSYLEKKSYSFQSMNSKESSWTQINPDGFGNKNNVAPRGITIFHDELIVGIGNYNNKTPITLGESLLFTDFLFEVLKNNTFQGNFRSDGCELWAYNGTSWTEIIGEKGLLPSGFGDKNNAEIGVLIVYKDYLYAGVRNLFNGFQIWRTPDLKNWEQIVKNGLGNPSNDAIWEAIIFQDDLYMGTINFDDGCEIFKTSTGDPGEWTAVLDQSTLPSSGFGTKDNFYVWSMSVYENELYIGTNNLNGGGELWKTVDGTSWSPVLAFKTTALAKENNASFPRGFSSGNTMYRGGIRTMGVYHHELYLGFTGEDLKLHFQFNGSPPFLKIHQQFPNTLFHPLQSQQTQGLEIYKYNNTNDEFTQVIGDTSMGNTASGFGDPRNEYPWSMFIDQDNIFIGTARPDPIVFEFSFSAESLAQLMIKLKIPTGGGEVWRFDGTTWEQINSDGFNDMYNIGIREIIMYHDALIACTTNVYSGCEIWKFD